MRIRTLDKIAGRTEEILRQRGVEDPKPIGPKALLPALEAASEESDETLQNMWASLLANAMDPDKDISLQQVFIDTLKQFEPIDALVLQEIAKDDPGELLNAVDLALALSRRESLLSVSLGQAQ